MEQLPQLIILWSFSIAAVISLLWFIGISINAVLENTLFSWERRKKQILESYNNGYRDAELKFKETK